VDVAALDLVLTITNSARGPVHFELAWNLGADYADIQEAQSGRREQESTVQVAAYDDRIEFAYGHSELRKQAFPFLSRSSSGERRYPVLRKGWKVFGCGTAAGAAGLCARGGIGGHSAGGTTPTAGIHRRGIRSQTECGPIRSTTGRFVHAAVDFRFTAH
jgi:hypothetical protein